MLSANRTMSPLFLKNVPKSLGQITQKANICMFGHTWSRMLNLVYDVESEIKDTCDVTYLQYLHKSSGTCTVISPILLCFKSIKREVIQD